MSLHCIKQLIHRKKIGNACTFGKNTTIDSKAYFEGMNRLGENTWFLNSSIGYASYISNNSFIKNTVIGRYTCIANDVMTVAGNHPTSFVSIHPAFYSLAQKPCESIYLSNEIIYNYNQIGESLTRSNKADTGTDIQSALDAFLVFYDKALETYHEYEMYIGRYICLKLLQLKKRAKIINDWGREKQIQVVLEKYRSRIGFQYYIALFKMDILELRQKIKKLVYIR